MNIQQKTNKNIVVCATLTALVLSGGVLAPSSYAGEAFVPSPVESSSSESASSEPAPFVPAPIESSSGAPAAFVPSAIESSGSTPASGAPAAFVPSAIETPADAAAVAQNGQALLQAVKAGNTSAVLSALQSGADVNARDMEAKTPLMWAAGLGRTDLVNTLLEQGADVNAVDKFGRGALHYVLAARQNAPAAAPAPPKKKSKWGKLLGKVKDVGLGVLTGGMSGLVSGALKGQLVNGLLNKGLGSSLLGQNVAGMLSGGNFDVSNTGGWSAVLGSAILGDNASGGAYALQSVLGGDLKNLDAAGWTNLISAAGKNDPQVLQAMSKLGPAVGAAQNQDWQQFLSLASQGNAEGVQKLMEGGNLQGLLQQATGSLQAAAQQIPGRDGGVSIVQTLLEKGANAAQTDKQGFTAQKWAQHRGLNDVAQLLQNAGAAK